MKQAAQNQPDYQMEVHRMTNEVISAKMELKELVDVFSNLADVKDAKSQGNLFLLFIFMNSKHVYPKSGMWSFGV